MDRNTPVGGPYPPQDRNPAPGIAIIGMSGRFPGAADVDQFWRNISTGVESFTQFSDEELVQAGEDPSVFRKPNYVRSRPILDDIRGFDAGLFGYSPREATLADPQQRIFLECVWEALESAGYATPEGRGTVGVFAGMNISTYLLTKLAGFGKGMDVDGLMIATDKDALATNVAFRLDLRGPSVAVQTFCSTSLVAVHLAAESLRSGECDLALAGGVSIRVPDRVGYLYQDGGQASPDGHVRTFDADARGSMFGDGAAVVVLKRLDRAVADRDTVLAVIRGSAVNNDGALKFSYQAPSIEGQRRCVAAALARAGVDPSQVSYVEAHGTATEVGDPMEVAALTGAFGPAAGTRYCLLGSIKPNVGHLDRASGATGLIKVVQSLRHELIPGTLNFSTPNPEIDFENSPFRVTPDPTPWPRQAGRPRIAGISSLGMGGTNAHVVLAEAPEAAPRPTRPRRWQVLPVSARTERAADEAVARLGSALRDRPGLDLGDVAYSLQVGRRLFAHRRVVVADSTAGAADRLLASSSGGGVLGRADGTVGRRVGFLLAGVGEQYPGMVAALYAGEPGFRRDVDGCVSVLGLSSPEQLTDLFVPATAGGGGADGGGAAGGGAAAGGAGDLARLLGRAGTAGPAGPPAAPHLVQPAVFVAEYALARQLIRWGIRPDIMIGYSLGEYVAACLSGVLSLPDALRLVAHRARLIASLPGGAMLAVAGDEPRLRSVLGSTGPATIGGLDVAVRAGWQVVLAGPAETIDEAGRRLVAAGIGCRRLATTHAFHSRMLAPVAAELAAWIADNITLNPPGIPFLSNVTGEPATEADVTDPGYWARHMCETVEFGTGLAHLLGAGDLALAEIGAGQSLGALTRGHPACDRAQWPLIVATLPGAADRQDPHAALAEAVGRLWLAGVPVDWPALHGDYGHADGTNSDGGNSDGGNRGGAGWVPGRVPLPGYPFQRQEYWPDGEHGTGQAAIDENDPVAVLSNLPRLPDTGWLNLPVWRQTAPPPAADAEAESARWLVYTDDGPADRLAAPLLAHLAAAGREVVLVRPGERFASAPGELVLRPGSPEDAIAALRSLAERGWLPQRVVHLWTLSGAAGTEECLRRGLHSLVALARAAGDLGLPAWSLDIVTSNSHRVLPGDQVRPERGTLLGPCLLIPVEYPRVRTRLIDTDTDGGTGGAPRALLAELRAEPADRVVGLRGGRRWLPEYAVLDAAGIEDAPPAAEIRPGGAYLVTGGLGGIGLAMAERLAARHQARLVLMGRTPVPPREQWGAILAAQSTAPEVRRRLEGLQRLAASGTDVITVAGDVSRVADARRAVEAAVERFGRLDGVLHCAGVPAVGLMQFKTPADIDRVLAPKVAGTMALAEALRGVPVGFMVLFSSVTSATGGGAGQVDYCAANAFLDAFALSDPLPGCVVSSVNWCEWTWNGWTTGLDNYDEESKKFFEWYRGTFGITFDEGWLAMRRVLRSGEPNVVVSTQDFAPLVRMSRNTSIESHQATVKKLRGGALGRHPRPDLSTAYLEPQSPAELAIAEVWSEALGLERIGVHDNFFELGGNSLIGMEIIAAVRAALGVAYLPPHLLYQAPTVAALADAATAGEGRNGTRDRNRSRIEQRRSMLRSGSGR